MKEVWAKETDFSDWLASPMGLELIASDIGVEIENARRECSPGDFRCDIVGHQLGDENHAIVIENQYNKTDHDHLGKMLTYAAVHDATTGIWISERISDDHRQAIDWLNSITPANVNFYLAQIKAYRIDDSAVAPELTLICSPNLAAKARRIESKESVNASNNGIWNKDFWDDISSFIKERNPPFKIQRSTADSWTGVAIGRSGFFLALVFETKQPCIRCELCVNPAWRFSAFEQLIAQRAEIEQEIGASLDWLPLPDKKISRIRLKADMDVKDSSQRDAIKDWMNTQINAFYHAFRPRVQSINANFISSNDVENTPEVSGNEFIAGE